MTKIQELLGVKGSHVETIEPDATVFEAAQRMNQHKIGSLVVLEGPVPVGIFTERDILVRIVAQRRHPDETRVSDVMTRELVCCQPHTSVEEARGVMKNRRIRHLPVINEQGQLLGLISIGDLNAHESHAKELTIH